MIDWKIEKIGDNFLVTDYVANGSFASLSENVTYINTPDYAILVRTTDNTKKWNGNYVYVSKNSFDFLKKSSLLLDDLIIANVGDPGKAFLCPDLGQPMTLGPNSILVRPLDKNKIMNKYFYYYTTSKTGQRQIQDICSATAQKKFNKTSYRSLEIPLPPFLQQQKIANILDAADELRQNDKALIAKYDELTSALFLDMFGDPVSNPKGWEKVKFDKVGKLDRGKSKHRPRNAPELLGGIYPLIQTGDIANSGGYITEYKSTYSEFGLAQSRLWKSGTLCITIAANIAKTGILTFDACFPDSVVGFIPNGKTNNIYTQCWMSFLQKIIEDAAPESAQKNINLAILKDLNFPLPPMNLQNQFAERVALIEEQKAIAQASLIKSEELFNSLLQKAFKGELV